MRLKEIFKEQKDFQKYFYDPDNLSEEEKIKFTKEYVLSIHKELSEILDTIPWKLHRKDDKVKSTTNTLEEIIDCFKFLLNLCIIHGIDDEIFVNAFQRKSAVVRQRYNQEILKRINKTDKICAIDLDDVLADSSRHFTEVYNDMYATQNPYKTRVQIKKTLNPLEYEEFKEYFRESGIKLNIPIKTGAKELCDFLKSQDYKIIIISARPYERYSRIFSDTLQWLNNNQIQFDAVYFEKDKHLKILREFPNLSFIVEDNPEYARQISNLKYKVFLLTNESEEESETELRKKLGSDKNIVLVDSLFDIIKQKIDD